jgi:putative transposase
VTKLCDVLEVKRTSYYAWDKRLESKRYKRKKEITKLVIKNFHDNKRIPGSVKISGNISTPEHPIGRKLVAKIMKENGCQ